MKTMTKFLLGGFVIAGLVASRKAVGMTLCGLRGHDSTMNFEKNRLSLKCNCGYESEGWETGRRVVDAKVPITPEAIATKSATLQQRNILMVG